MIGISRAEVFPAATAQIAAVDPTRVGAPFTRFYNWDRLRILASLDILASHLSGRHLFGGVGLPMFVLISVALWCRKPPAADGGALVRKRAARLLGPWLFWSAVISAVFALRVDPATGSRWSWLRPAMLLYGPEIQGSGRAPR